MKYIVLKIGVITCWLTPAL